MAKQGRKRNPSRDVKRRARERFGLPPAERVIPDKRRKPPKHKKPRFDEDL